MSDLCKSWSTVDGQCMSCYYGYDLSAGKCTIYDPFCTIQSVDGCVQCVNRYYLDINLHCQVVNPLCKSYDPLSGACTDCFDGYKLAALTCIVAWFSIFYLFILFFHNHYIEYDHISIFMSNYIYFNIIEYI